MTDALTLIAPKPATPAGERRKRRGRRSLAELRAANGGTGTRPAKPTASDKGASNSLGARVRLARRRLGLSQQELAGPQYVASYISAIERDKIHPSLKALELIAIRLGEPVEYFLYGGYGSGALTPTKNEAEEPNQNHQSAVPTTSLASAMRDKLLETQLSFERASHLPLAQAQTELIQIEQNLNSIPRHQLSEYDRAQLNYLLGQVYFQKHDYAEARTELDEALILAEKTEQPILEVEIRAFIAKILQSEGGAEQALLYHQACREALQTQPELYPIELKLVVLCGLARDYLSLHLKKLAVEIFKEAQKIEAEAEKPEQQARHYFNLAQLYEERGDLSRSRAFRQLSLSLYEQLNQKRQVLQLSSNMGELLLDMGQVEEAEKILTRAVTLGQVENRLNGADLALTYNGLAALRLRQNQLAEAARISRQAVEKARQAGDRLTEGKALQLAAEIQTRLDHQNEGHQLYQNAISTLEPLNIPYVMGDVYKSYGEALEKWGDFANAVSFLKKAYESKR